MRRLIQTILILSCLIPAAACSPQNSEPEETVSPIAGSYRLSSLTDSSGEAADTLIGNVRDEGYEITLQLDEDGSGVLTVFTTDHDVTWTENELVIEGDAMKLEWDKGTLTLRGDDGPGQMVFVADSH